MRPRVDVTWLVLIPTLALTGCDGVQSALLPGGREALEIRALFWTVTAVAAAITLLMIVISVVALWGPQPWRGRLARTAVITGGGIVLPAVVLSGLFIYGLVLQQAGAGRSREAEATITVTGKLWWWRVVYQAPDGREITSANELRLPVGRPIAVRLKSDDVIHSFWAPRLGGKLDMIPGRTNVITIEATEPGISRGQCAEYCGGAHALMAFHVVALPEDQYDAWLEREAGPAQAPSNAVEERGLELFLTNGCGACHAIRGTPARGIIGPDLTHVGSRRSLGAATLPNDAQSFARWIKDNQHIKPENLMPPYRQFSSEELDAVAAYLDALN